MIQIEQEINVYLNLDVRKRNVTQTLFKRTSKATERVARLGMSGNGSHSWFLYWPVSVVRPCRIQHS